MSNNFINNKKVWGGNHYLSADLPESALCINAIMKAESKGSKFHHELSEQSSFVDRLTGTWCLWTTYSEEYNFFWAISKFCSLSLSL